jgi:hypothetical protein
MITVIIKIIPIIHKVVPVTPPTSLPIAANPRKPERNFNVESIVNTNAIISKITTTATDPTATDGDDGEKKKILLNSNPASSAAEILNKTLASIAYKDPHRKSCNALTSGLDIIHLINLCLPPYKYFGKPKVGLGDRNFILF